MNPALLAQLRSMSELELYRELYCDPLTRVQNRRAFEAADFAAVAVVDMDSLKYLNDSLGHRTGDRYLTLLAQALVREFGQANVFRIAGDEFAVTGTDCDRLREGLETAREHFRGFSFGVACTLVQADTRLRREKLRREQQGVRASRGEPPPWLGKKAKKVCRGGFTSSDSPTILLSTVGEVPAAEKRRMTMNTQQAATARRLSLRCADFCNNGNIAFVAEPLPGDTVLFRATNVYGDLRWYESAEDFMCFIGPRGGVRRATGSLARYVTK